MEERLSELYYDWVDWAADADKSEDGWQSDYPLWDKLMSSAAKCMESPSCMELSYDIVAKCWAISEETEDLADYAKEHYEQVRESVFKLAESGERDARWQVYSVLGQGGDEAEEVLRQGLRDSDSYCRRRAILSLARHRPSDAGELATKYMRDQDPYIRQAAIELARASDDPAVVESVKRCLLEDDVTHVQKAARSLDT